MSLSIVCFCGARLEIDDRFAGQSIPCPDCQKPLDVPTPEPVRERRLSGLAVASVIVGLIGFFTLIGSLVAVVLGYLADRSVQGQSQRLTGLRLARTGMILGGAGLALTLAALFAPDVLNLGVLLRELEWGRRLDYVGSAADPPVFHSVNDIALTAPEQYVWGKVQQSGADNTDVLILANVGSDAQISCQAVNLEPDDQNDWDLTRERGVTNFYKSELVHLLGRLRVGDVAPPGNIREVRPIDTNTQELLLDMRLGGVDRTFLLRMSKRGFRLVTLVGAARQRQFEQLEPQFRKSFNSLVGE